MIVASTEGCRSVGTSKRQQLRVLRSKVIIVMEGKVLQYFQVNYVEKLTEGTRKLVQCNFVIASRYLVSKWTLV